jgi:hypothetical protein
MFDTPLVAIENPDSFLQIPGFLAILTSFMVLLNVPPSRDWFGVIAAAAAGVCV